MKIWNKILLRVVIYGLLAAVGFLAYQNFVLYIEGIARNPYQTIYKNTTPYQAAELKLKKGETRVLEPCVPLKVIHQSASRLGETEQRELAGERSGQQSSQGQEQTSLKSQLVNRFSIRPSLDALVAELYLQPDGSTRLSLTPDPKLFSLGRLREFGMWIGYSPQSGGLHSQLTPWFIDLRYQQDLFKVGPLLFRGSASAGYQNIQGFKAEVALGAVVRF